MQSLLAGSSLQLQPAQKHEQWKGEWERGKEGPGQRRGKEEEEGGERERWEREREEEERGDRGGEGERRERRQRMRDRVRGEEWEGGR